MERLTCRDKKGEAHLHCYQMCADAHEDCNTAYEVDRCQRYVAFRKLADYEDAEEQGLLLRLPCKVGDTIYIVFYNHTIGEREVVSFRMIAKGWAVKTNDWSYLFTDFGKTVFLTRAEAEAKLKEMECSHE